METVYNKEYFLEKFFKIPSEKIGIGFENNCALMHCGTVLIKNDYILSEEANALGELFKPLSDDDVGDNAQSVYRINDNSYYVEGNTPKERILNALNSLP